MRNWWLFILSVVFLSACYYPEEQGGLYEVNDNFVISSDSIVLQAQQPLHNMPVDTLSDSVVLFRNDPLVIAQVLIIPEDSIDSVWVKVARDQFSQGWLHQQTLLSSVVPDDPISQFINLFSQRHLWYFLGGIFVAIVLLLWRQMRHSRFHIIFLDDIPTFYPTFLTIAFSGSAVLYASIQRFVPETWVLYYYHPTLNPFELPFILSLFLCSFWLVLVLLIATLDEVFRQLPFAQAVLYMISLSGFCLVSYLVFTLAALSWMGYLLYLLFVIFAIRRYYVHFRPQYLCGRCGAKLHNLGRCPNCGAENR